MSPRPDVSAVRKNQILDAAMAVFARMGFHEARMDDIVLESGLSKGALYWYFKSKEDIITAISQRVFTRELEQIEGLVAAEGSPSERLLQLTRNRVEGLERMSNLVPILVEFYAASVRQTWVRQFIEDYFKGFHDLLVTLIQQGIDRGEFRPVDASETALFIAALFEGLIIHWLIEPEKVQWDGLIERSVQLLLDGLKQ
jgi:AcrR family transcriptional regulator